MRVAFRVVAVLGVLAWTAAQTIACDGYVAVQRPQGQSTRSGEREVILETPRQGWVGEK